MGALGLRKIMKIAYDHSVASGRAGTSGLGFYEEFGLSGSCLGEV